MLGAEEVVHASYDVLSHVLRNAIIPCKHIGLIFNLVEPGRALMKFIANLSDACTTSSVLGAFCEMIRFINCVAQFVNSQNALQFIKKKMRR